MAFLNVIGSWIQLLFVVGCLWSRGSAWKAWRTLPRTVVSTLRSSPSVLHAPELEPKPIFRKLPVTVLSGFLGSGKTTLLTHLLTNNEHKKKYAVIVNDMAELNIDGALLGPHIQHREEQLVELSNGCICCTLREDLIQSITDLALQQHFDHLLIESTGISEPLPVAETFLFAPTNLSLTWKELKQRFDFSNREVIHSDIDNSELSETTASPTLSDLAELDSLVTVVDCVNLLRDIKDAESLSARDLSVNETDTRSVTDLLVHQIEFATVIVLNKCDLVSELELGKVRQIIRALNADAVILETSYGQIDPARIIGVKNYDFERVSQSATWMRALHHSHDDHDLSPSSSSSSSTFTSEAEEYGISSLVYRVRRPFHPQRLYAFIEQYLDPWNEEEEETQNKVELATQGTKETSEVLSKKIDIGRILRSKGFFWLASRWSQSLVWSQAGGLFTLSPGGMWLHTALLRSSSEDVESSAEELQDWRAEIGNDWLNDQIGDRRQEIVFIGVHLQKEKLQQLLDECLISEEEMQTVLNQEAAVLIEVEENPLGLEDPFPVIVEEDDEEVDEEVEVEILEPATVRTT